MQVSYEFAKKHTKQIKYPYEIKKSLRDELFTRRGGIYFGMAYLLGYKINYDDIVHRFADFNAGHYASRNAAFQKALSMITGIELDYDGDLLSYDQDEASPKPSQTFSALKKIIDKLGMNEAEVLDNLKHEKSPDFVETKVYQSVFSLAESKFGKTLPKEIIPNIRLNSPKIKSKFTTEEFARKVKDRYIKCL